MDTPTRATAVHDVDTALLRSWAVPMPAPARKAAVAARMIAPGISLEPPSTSTWPRISLSPSIAGIKLDAVARLDPLAERVDTILVGPGMRDEPATAELVHALLPRFEAAGTTVVLDACAMGALLHPPGDWPPDRPWRFERPVILTPHAGEMAHLTGIAKEDICLDPDPRALVAARDWNAMVVLKGARTVIATPDGTLYQHEGGNVGLAISGSGDVLAGIIAGLAARGAALDQAACWGVALHARSGEQLARRMGTLGYLAREISQEIPALLEQIAGKDAVDHETIRPAPVAWGTGA